MDRINLLDHLWGPSTSRMTLFECHFEPMTCACFSLLRAGPTAVLAPADVVPRLRPGPPTTVLTPCNTTSRALRFPPPVRLVVARYVMGVFSFLWRALAWRECDAMQPMPVRLWNIIASALLPVPFGSCNPCLRCCGMCMSFAHFGATSDWRTALLSRFMVQGGTPINVSQVSHSP